MRSALQTDPEFTPIGTFTSAGDGSVIYAPTGKTEPVSKVNTFAALRELDAMRRRLTKGRTLRDWIPEHVPAEIAATVTDLASLQQARDALKATVTRDDPIGRIEQDVSDDLAALVSSLGSGAVSTAGFVDDAVDVMRHGIRSGLAHGAAHASDGVIKALGPEFTGRYGLYTGSIPRAYQQGYGLATVGASDDPDNIVVTWHAKPGACDLCEPRNGEEFTVAGLPGFPGSGGFGKQATICRGGPNCRCSLAFRHVGTLERLVSPPEQSTSTPTAIQQQIQADMTAASRALHGPNPQPAFSAVLDQVADGLAEAQRPYLTGFLQDILAAMAGLTAPEALHIGYTLAPDGGPGWLVPASVISTAVAAAIAAQVRSQQQAAPATTGQPQPA